GAPVGDLHFVDHVGPYRDRTLRVVDHELQIGERFDLSDGGTEGTQVPGGDRSQVDTIIARRHERAFELVDARRTGTQAAKVPLNLTGVRIKASTVAGRDFLGTGRQIRRHNDLR